MATLKDPQLAQPQCPLRPGDPCALCHPGAHGPEDCGLVYLVTSDPELRGRLQVIWDEHRLVRA